jgi:hypothetical protein
MKILQAAILIFSLGLAGAAQSRNQAPVRTDLMSTLLELDRTAASTNSDISHLQIEKWKGGWKTGFTTSTSHKNKAEQSAQALQRNLRGALPELIRDAMNTRGGLLPTFKVYEDVVLVCQTLDSLVETAEQYGSKEEYAPLMNDYNNLVRLRRVLSMYIQQRAAAADGGGSPASYSTFTSPVSTEGTPLPRKIIVDDGMPDRKPVASPKKNTKSTIPYSNVE